MVVRRGVGVWVCEEEWVAEEGFRVFDLVVLIEWGFFVVLVVVVVVVEWAVLVVLVVVLDD